MSKAFKIILYAICSVSIISIVAYYIYEVAVLGIPFEKNLTRAIGMLLTFSLVIAKLASGKAELRHTVSYYENMYAEETEGAFENAPSKRRKLFRAIRYYHEGKNKKALASLRRLFRESEEKYDIRAAGLFLGLALTQAGDVYGAVRVYESVLAADPYYARIYNNLGHVYSLAGRSEKALENYAKAIEINPRNAHAHNNIANLYFGQSRFEEAEDYAKRALDIEPSLYQAATLLAILYSVKGDESEAKKYFHAAVSNGQDAQLLRNAIERNKKNFS